MSADEIDSYLSGLDDAPRETLERLRQTIRAILPEAEEGLSYGAPVFRLGGRPIAGFSAAVKHVSYLPHSGSVTTLLAEELTGYAASKGAIKLPFGSTLPHDLVAHLIAARRAELDG